MGTPRSFVRALRRSTLSSPQFPDVFSKDPLPKAPAPAIGPKTSIFQSAYVSQVIALVRKDLLLKRRRKCTTCFDLLFPLVAVCIIVVIFFLADEKTRNETPLTVMNTAFHLDSSGSGSIEADPFPVGCLGATMPDAVPDETPDVTTFKTFLASQHAHLALLFSNAYHFPDASIAESSKKFAIGPPDIATKLEAYLAHRVRARRNVSGDPKKIFARLKACPCVLQTWGAFECCLKRCLGRPCSIATTSTTTTTAALSETTTKCDALKTVCECSKNPTCGWLQQDTTLGFKKGLCKDKESSGGLYHGGVSCAACNTSGSDPREKCSVSNVWQRMDELMQTLTPKIVPLDDNDALDEAAALDDHYCAGVFFDATDSNTVSYTLRFAATAAFVRSKESHTRPLLTLLPDIGDFEHRSGPNLYLQRVVDEFIMCNSSFCLNKDDFITVDGNKEQIRVSAFPIPARRHSEFLSVVLNAMKIVFKWIITVLALVWSIHLLREKEWKVKDAMLAHGVQLPAYYTALSIFMLFWSMMCTLLPALVVAYVPRLGGEHALDASGGTLFLLLWLCLWNAYTLMAVLSVFFRRTFPSVFFIAGIFQILEFVLDRLTKDTTSHFVLRLVSLHPTVNMVRAADTLRYLDLSLNANDFSVDHQYYSLGDSVGANLFAILLWTLLFVYFDMVRQDGSTYRWYFPFTFWRGFRECVRTNVKEQNGDLVQPPTTMEKNALDAHRVIQVSNLTKKYGDTTAVNGIHATMYAGEIFALLGHNGAGKTTTFGMISGMTSVDGGEIRVFGRPLQEHLKRNRNKVGFCPQQNLVWPILTVNDHLRLFRSFKGIQGDADIDGVLSMLALADKKEAQVSTLSGGMVRKLCLAMSLLGDPDVLLLDEPTSGLDPTARREVWNMLLSRKHNRIVILSTHYMEEADTLGDRVAIMNNGSIACNGSPAFLKKKYGCGYNLTCLMDKQATQQCKLALRDLVANTCVGDEETVSVQVLSNVGREVTFVLGFAAAKYFPSLFAQLDKQSSRVESYSVAVSNLEEVFVKVASQGDRMVRQAGMARIGGIAAGPASFVCQLQACMTKRLFYSRRKWSIDLCTFAVPIIFVLLALALGSVASVKPMKIALAIPAPTGTQPDPSFGHIYTPSAPTILASGPKTSVALDSYTQRLVAAAHAPEFHTTSSNWSLASATPCSDMDTATCTVRGGSGSEHSEILDLIGPMLNEAGDRLRYAAFVFPNASVSALSNLHATEGPGMALNLYSNMLLQAQNKTGRIRAWIKDIPTTDSVHTHYVAQSKSYLVPIFILAGLGIAALIFTTLILIEKDQGILRQQMSVGLRLLPYWISNWIVDVFVHLLTFGAIYAILLAANITTYIGTEFDQFAFTLVLFIVCALVQPIFCYVVCAISGSANTASMVLFFSVVVVAQLLLSLGPRLDLRFSTGGDDGAHWHNLLLSVLWIARLIPGYALANGLYDLDYLVGTFWARSPLEGLDDAYFEKCKNDADIRLSYSLECSSGVWDFRYGPPRNLIMLLVSLVFWPLVLALLSWTKQATWLKERFSADQAPLNRKQIKDIDVLSEEARVANMANSVSSTNVILANNLRKVFKVSNQPHKYVHAVQGVSFAADVGEVFGLLGVNGAGKSTMFKMLAGEEVPLRGKNATTCALRVQRDRGVGYCPQHDPLWECLTPREHLIFTCRVKGIAPHQVEHVVADLMRAVDLMAYADVQSALLSGGNKRKLCVAMSLVGTPKILFLDEPSAGVDPVSRRFMWGVIQQIAERDKSTTVVLTTHSMEECEALCTRTAIMVNGVFRCIGPNARIRDTYGQGATLDISFFAEDRDQIHAHLLAQWGLDLKTEYLNYNQVRQFAIHSPYHAELLSSGASCFSSVVNVVAVKKSLDLYYDEDRNRVESSQCSARVVTQWWHSVILCQAFASKLHETLEHDSDLIKCEEIHGDKCRFNVELDQLTLNDLFSAMEELKNQKDIEDYTLSRATLESIFNRFARELVENRGYGKNKCF